MVEIGKKDILDRNMLSMEPFNRNASFKALDLSHEQITDDMLSRYVFLPSHDCNLLWFSVHVFTRQASGLTLS